MPRDLLLDGEAVGRPARAFYALPHHTQFHRGTSPGAEPDTDGTGLGLVQRSDPFQDNPAFECSDCSCFAAVRGPRPAVRAVAIP